MLLEKFKSYRKLAIASLIFNCIGLVSAYFVQYLPDDMKFVGLFVTTGIFPAIGAALIFGPSLLIIDEWVGGDHTAIANGFVTCGTSFGAIVYNQIAQRVMELNDWWLMYLVFAGFFFVIFVFATCVFKENKTKPNSNKQYKVVQIGNQYLDFFDWIFSIMACSMGSTMLAYYIPPVLLPMLSTNENCSEFVLHYIMAIFGLANMAGRLLSGVFVWAIDKYSIKTSDSEETKMAKQNYSTSGVYIASLLISSAASFVFAFTKSYGDVVFISYTIVYGFAAGIFIALRSPVVNKMYNGDEQKSKKPFMFCLTFQGCAAILGFILAGKSNSIP